jgi:LPXTG-site transpeptidase (sortase) family protein
MEIPLKPKSLLFIAAGLLLVVWATTRVTAEILPALQPTSTPVITVLEEYGPNNGPLVASGTQVDLESQPVGATLVPEQTSIPSAQPDTNTADLPTGQPGDQQLDGPFLAPVEPTPTAVPTQVEALVPSRVVIPAISLDAPVTLASSQKIRMYGQTFYQWLAPDMFAAGWHTNSAFLGQPGNTVLDGHHNISGRVFGRLIDLNINDKVDVYSGDRVFHWIITNKMILPERDAPLAQRLENARWIGHSDDTRLTLITCWPANNNTHRLIIVAVPNPEGFSG